MEEDKRSQIAAGTCSICGKPAVERHRPFCSRRCALIDFGRWIGGNYRTPAEQADEEQVPPDEQPE